jgi:dihydroflavonol-4-reductase
MPRIQKLVYCSSTGAIPEQPEGIAIKEINYFDETKVPGCYAMSKALATQEVLDAVHHRGLNACVVHPSGIMGPGDYAIGEPTQNLIRIINGELPAGVDGDFNLCDVRDLAQGVIAAAEKGRCGECYILANEPVEFKEFCRMVTDASGGKKVSFFLPIFAANIMGYAMETIAKKKGEKPLLTTFNVYSMARNNHFDSGKAKEELGYSTRSYEETIHDMMEWLLAEGIIKKED